MKDRIRSAEIVLPCANLNRSLEFFTQRLGFRLEMIFPADAPSTAVVSGYGVRLRLESSTEKQHLTLNLIGDFSAETEREIFSPEGVRIKLIDEKSSVEIPETRQEFVLTTLENDDSW